MNILRETLVYLTLSSSHTMYTVHYLAEQLARGDTELEQSWAPLSRCDHQQVVHGLGGKAEEVGGAKRRGGAWRRGRGHWSDIQPKYLCISENK